MSLKNESAMIWKAIVCFQFSNSSSIIFLKSSSLVSREVLLLTIVSVSLSEVEGFIVGVKLEPIYVSAGVFCVPIWLLLSYLFWWCAKMRISWDFLSVLHVCNKLFVKSGISNVLIYSVGRSDECSFLQPFECKSFYGIELISKFFFAVIIYELTSIILSSSKTMKWVKTWDSSAKAALFCHQSTSLPSSHS